MAGQKIRIMYVIGSMGNGRAGTEKNLLTIIEGLDRSRFEPHLVSLQDCEYVQGKDFICETSCLHLYRMFTPQMWKVRRQLATRMGKLGIDIVQTFFVEGHLVGGGAARIACMKAIISSRRNLGYGYTFKERLFLELADRYPTCFLANCQAVADTISKLERVDRSKFDVIYNGVSLPTLPQESSKSVDPIVVMVANLRPIKAVEVLIMAAGEVCKKYPKARFQIIGDGPDKDKLAELVKHFQLSNSIEFVGSQSDLAPFLSRASIGVLTSRSEGCSNALLEYMAYGLPVVATRVGGNSELIDDNESGYLVTKDDTGAVAERLINLLSDLRKSRVMGQEGRKRVERSFSLKVMIRNHEEYYERLLQ